jgi:prepilin-type N-terminal cleavage/methylation domain-containing protein
MSYPFNTAPLSREAFTLLEVLVAMGIFALAVLGLLHALNVTVDTARDIARQKEIRRNVESRMARLSGVTLNPFSATTENAGVRYTEEVRPEPIKSQNLTVIPGYWIVKVRADWRDGADERNWSVSHLIWNP